MEERIYIALHTEGGPEGLPEISIDAMLPFPEIVLCGEITVRTAPRVVELIHRLGYRGHQGHVIVSLAEYCEHWAFQSMVKDADGVEFTALHPFTRKGLKSLRELCRMVEGLPGVRHDCLYADPKITGQAFDACVGSAREHWSKVMFDIARPDGKRAAYRLAD